jgi:ubiquinone/menaquinone biosynthesis C-methylase UbiE
VSSVSLEHRRGVARVHLALVLRTLLLSSSLLGVACTHTAPEPETRSGTESSREESVRPGVNDTFVSDDLDVDRFVEIFEGESREVYAQRRAIVQALHLSPGMDVADIGAGTGLFMKPLADGVGEDGTVYAVDISPRFIEHLRERARQEGLAQVHVVLGRERSVELPSGSVDLALVCDTYHHFEYPRSTLASLREAIRPGGALVIIDFERVPGESSDWALEHVREGKKVVMGEIEAAGFAWVEEVRVDGLDENYVLRFRRP